MVPDREENQRLREFRFVRDQNETSIRRNSLSAIVLRHYWDFLGYVLYGVLNDPVPAAPARLAVSVLTAALTS
jgi:hypothetical protein